MASGKLGTVSEVLQAPERDLAGLRARIDAGLEDAKVGRVYSPEEAKAMLRKRREAWTRTAQ